LSTGTLPRYADLDYFTAFFFRFAQYAFIRRAWALRAAGLANSASLPEQKPELLPPLLRNRHFEASG
jgi:hypothetical protein